MANDTGSESDRVLRVLMRFGYDEQSAKEITTIINSQNEDVQSLIRTYADLKKETALSEEERLALLKGSAGALKMNEDQVKAIADAYNAKAEAETTAAKQIQTDLDAENDRLKKIQENTDQIAQSFTNVLALGRAEVSLGRGISAFGKLIGNEDIKKIGTAVTGVGRLTTAIGRLPQAIKAVQQMGGLGSLVAGGLAIGGGALAGASIYDQMIQQGGLLGGQGRADAGTIVKQTLSSAGASIAAAFAGANDKAEVYRRTLDDTAHMYGVISDETYKASQAQYDAAARAKVENEAFAASIDHTAISTQQAVAGLEVMGNILKGLGAAGAGAAVARGLAISPQFKDAITAFDEYQKNIAKSEEKYGDERQKIIDANLKQINALTENFEHANAQAWSNYLKAQQKADEKYADQRIKILTSGADEEQKAEASYYTQRAKAAESYNIEIQRMEQAHQIEMQRMSEDHGKRLRKLADSRDALGIEDEMENYRTERQRAEEDYQRQASQKSEDFARQMADMEQQFQQQEKVRRDDRQRQLAELAQQKAQDDAQRKQDYTDAANERAKQYAEQLDADKQNGKDKLDELDQQHQDELSQLSDAWDTRRRQLNLWLTGEQKQWDNYMKARQDDLQKWIETHLSAPGATGEPTTQEQTPGHPVSRHQAGGYQDYTGLAYMHAGEFVANRQTTQALEKLVGGYLTQGSLLGAAGGGGNTISIEVNQQFSGQQSSPEQYKAIVHQTIVEVIDKAMRQ